VASISEQHHAEIFSGVADCLAEVLWYLLHASQKLESLSWTSDRSESLWEQRVITDFGKEVGGDEIHWWVWRREDDLELLRERTQVALTPADRLMKAAKKLRRDYSTYAGLVKALRMLVEQHQPDVSALHAYVAWLHQRDPLAPTMLFTYRVWGSTNLSDRWLALTSETPAAETHEIMRSLTEITLGLRGRFGRYAFNLAQGDILEQFVSDEMGWIPELSDSNILPRTNWYVHEALVAFFQNIRNSLRNILLDIDKCASERQLLHSEAFWRRFILAAAKTKKNEPQLWDFKETLDLWHAKGKGRNSAKVKLAEDVASFANTEGGVLVVGVTNDRQVVGIPAEKAESWFKTAREVLAERLDYSAECVSFQQVVMAAHTGGDALCLVIATAKTRLAVGVSDGAAHYTYPVRRETGVARVSRSIIQSAKLPLTGDSHDYIKALQQVVDEARS
jgi:hypothetical protein